MQVYKCWESSNNETKIYFWKWFGSYKNNLSTGNLLLFHTLIEKDYVTCPGYWITTSQYINVCVWFT